MVPDDRASVIGAFSAALHVWPTPTQKCLRKSNQTHVPAGDPSDQQNSNTVCAKAWQVCWYGRRHQRTSEMAFHSNFVRRSHFAEAVRAGSEPVPQHRLRGEQTPRIFDYSYEYCSQQSYVVQAWTPRGRSYHMPTR